MNEAVINALTEEACPSIRYRTHKEILCDNPDIDAFLDDILNDSRVRFVFSWRREDGFFGEYFHAGWIPEQKIKYFGQGTETALRFLSEMGVPADYPAVRDCLDALQRDDWNRDPWKWSTEFIPEKGLFGPDHIRAIGFVYYGNEEPKFVRTEIERACEYVTAVSGIALIDDVTDTYGKKLYYKDGFALPDLYSIKLLAFSQGWKTEENVKKVSEAMQKLIDFSPLPKIFIKMKSQLIAPASFGGTDLGKPLSQFDAKDWFWWMNNMELFARMGIVPYIPLLQSQLEELKALLDTGDGFFHFKPYARNFEVWGVYPGLALEEKWTKQRWRFDMTFRSYLILKFAGML